MTSVAEPSPIIARDISFRYGEKPVLNGCSFSVSPGELVALAGPNGAGKSTLISLLSGCQTPNGGTVNVFGREASQWPPRELAQRMAVLPQRDLTPGAMTGLEATLLGRSPFLEGFFRFESREDVAIARAALERVGAGEFTEKRLSTMSGGERQLVCLARALAQKPDLLLLDEPATGLDLGHQQALFRLLRSLNREEGITLISVTHDLNLAALYFDRLVLLHNGLIHGDGAPDSLLKPEILEPVYGAELWTLQTPHGGTTVGLMP
ncbi:MAG: ABC transporter ATP-binding protein [Candidatus Sumerlaeia bacterium]|nr:ABC transporter ATP-binding protein [Candidatus Sumerlaeia bacterium]